MQNWPPPMLRLKTNLIKKQCGIFMAFFCSCLSAHEPNLPLWDAGVALGATRIPHYRGSSSYNTWGAPGPLFILRGDIFKVDDDGVRTEFRLSERAAIDLSFGATLPVKAEERGARAGMGRLEATAETGPALKLNLWSNESKTQGILLKLPLRAQFVIEGARFRPQGVIFAPYVQFHIRNLSGSTWGYSLSTGPLLADKKYYEHFYNVPLEFVTLNRDAYTSPSGYGGSRMILNVYNARKPISYGFFLRWDDLHQAQFEASPLVEETYNISVGFAVSWYVWSSKIIVPASPL
jgi:MipA family protein